MEIGTIILIIILIILAILFILAAIYEFSYEAKYKLPSIAKKIKKYEMKKDKKLEKEKMKIEVKKTFNKLIHLQNLKISEAMKQNKRCTEFIFINNRYYRYPIISYVSYNNQYKQNIIDMATKYYKKYKIDGNKISWD